MTEAEFVPPGVDPTTPSPARLYDYYLGGTNNFEVDRVAAERMRAIMPELSDAAWANRGFHQRAAIWIAEQGVSQFIDIGSGLPTRGNTHEAVQKVDTAIRVVYVDYDPMVQALAEGLLTDDGTTRFILADMREPEALLASPELRGHIDLAEPVGLLMTSVVHFMSDEMDPHGLVARYMQALAPGSYLVLSHVTHDLLPPRMVQAGLELYRQASEQLFPRSKPQVERFFTGLELIEPFAGAGPQVCYVGLWGAEDPDAADSDGSRVLYCGVGRRP